MALTLTDMAMPPPPKEQLAGKRVGQPVHDPYSYQHRISLDDEALTKLGIKDTPELGDKFLIHAHGEVTDTQEAAHADHKDGKKTRNVSIQLKRMAASPMGAGSLEGAVNKGVSEASDGE
jgi:hypothetical protein